MISQQGRRAAMRRWTFTFLTTPALLLAALAMPACTPRDDTAANATPIDDPPRQSAGVAYDAGDLEEAVRALEEASSNLPGRSDAAHRDAMRAAMDALAGVLPGLQGPEASGAFRVQLAAVEFARDRLSPDAPASTVEPTIDAGLRAATGAFERISRDDALAGPELAAMVKELRTTLDNLDNARSVGRPYGDADAVKLMARISRKMAGALAMSVTGVTTPVPADRASPLPDAQPAAASLDDAPAVLETVPATPETEPAPAETEPGRTEAEPALDDARTASDGKESAAIDAGAAPAEAASDDANAAAAEPESAGADAAPAGLNK